MTRKYTEIAISSPQNLSKYAAKEAEEHGHNSIVFPCPNCKSKDFSILGTAWIIVTCNECEFQSHPHSHGSRCEKYNDAITDWNSGEGRLRSRN